MGMSNEHMGLQQYAIGTVVDKFFRKVLHGCREKMELLSIRIVDRLRPRKILFIYDQPQ